MASESVYRLLDILSEPSGAGTNTRQRLAAVQEIERACKREEVDVLDRLETIISLEKDTTVRVATAKAMITILTGDPKRDISQDHVKRLVKFMANDREEICEQAVNALTGLGPDAEDPLWASLGTGTYPANISDTIARSGCSRNARPCCG